VATIETLEVLAQSFEKLYLALGNADFQLSQRKGLIPENVKWFSELGAFELEGKKIAICHSPNLARKIAVEQDYDIVFYGHTHTPWEKNVENTVLLNPGEIAGQYGPASFCIYDLETMQGTLKILR
jgi:putative phosphoesterase